MSRTRDAIATLIGEVYVMGRELPITLDVSGIRVTITKAPIEVRKRRDIVEDAERIRNSVVYVVPENDNDPRR